MIKKTWKHNLFYFPTTILLLDDDIGFLHEASKILNENDMLVKTFSSSKPFFHYLAHNAMPINPDELFIKTEVDYYKGSSGIIRTNTNTIYKIAYNSARFNQVAVVVVDYEMMNETGLDVCKCIKDPNIKKIMLTNKASYKIGIDAMNHKVIDAFIEKGDIFTSLIDTIKSFEVEYFYDIAKKMQYASGFMNEPFIANLIDIYIKEKKPKEYYLFNNNKSFLFLDEYATPSGVFIESETTIKNIEETLRQDNISPNIIIPIAERRQIPAGWNPSKYLLGDYEFIMTPCNKISGNKEDYYYYYSDDPNVLNMDNDRIFPFIEKLNDNIS